MRYMSSEFMECADAHLERHIGSDHTPVDPLKFSTTYERAWWDNWRENAMYVARTRFSTFGKSRAELQAEIIQNSRIAQRLAPALIGQIVAVAWDEYKRQQSEAVGPETQLTGRRNGKLESGAW